MKHTPCIYRVDIGPYYYYGQTVKPRVRELDHRRKLSKKTHPNPKMQSVFDKSYEDLKFEVILWCEKDEMNYYEEALINKHYDDKYNMNIAKDATSPMLGRKQKKSTIEKRSAKLRGRKRTKEQRERMSRAAKKRGIHPKTREAYLKKAINKTLHKFRRKDGLELICTKWFLYKTFDLNDAALNRAIKSNGSHKGWRKISTYGKVQED